MEENQIIDVSKIVIIPSDTEIPVHNNPIQTKRPLCANFPENGIILDKLEAVFNPLNIQECTSDLFKGDYETISHIEELKKVLSGLLMRFDTNPKNYTKEDYSYLMGLLYKSLLHLYEINPISVIINEWDEIPRTDRVPSEKLIVDKIEDLISDIGADIYVTNEKLDEEISNRASADQVLYGNLDQEISNRQTEISRVDESISDINDLIPSEATSSNQLADKEFVHDQIATNASNFRGDWSNWANVPTDANDYPADYTGNKKPNNNDYLIIQNATDYGQTYTGIWRFYYQGDWDTLGKSGWQPQYRVEQAFTQEQLDSINSGVTRQKVSSYDGYSSQISTLNTNKVDKVSSSNSVYGTNGSGNQSTYTAGTGIAFENGKINNTTLPLIFAAL